MNDLTPFERFQLKTYGNILNVREDETPELEEKKSYLEDAYIYSIENPEV